jgi:hypothetical protein
MQLGDAINVYIEYEYVCGFIYIQIRALDY